jgi:DNA-binding NtrC family response regulator
MANVLILDDQPDIRFLLRAAVERDGHHALCAADVHEARELLQQQPDVLLADIAIGEHDGLDFTVETRARPGFAELPVVIVSADPNASNLVRESGLRSVEVLEKPFRFDDVTDTLRRLLH